MSSPDDAQRKRTPSWQQDLPPEPPTDPATELQEAPDPSSATPRASLIEKASRFLDDENIRTASTERKTSFLESKGLNSTEIQHLLQQQRHEKPNDQTPSNHQTSSENDPEPASETQPPSPQPKDQPPIITYPEFLLHTQKPPPLITARRLLTTLYLASGAAIAMYGTHKYVMEPMLESLNSARHTLFSTASTNLDTLNGKLEGLVSRLPELYNSQALVETEDQDDTETSSPDPARFFSKTAATQTTPHLSRSPSPSSSSITSTPPPPSRHLDIQSTHLSNLHRALTDLTPISNLQVSDPLQDNLNELQDFLASLPYLGSIGGGRTADGGKGDAVSRVKAEVRGVKGVLLSARNFPMGGIGGR